ncbi:DUF411 domain-containing protein [[Pseudomonas] carboxydohydrogena]|jgi:hypothetical protein|uniref:DUF411 domain-containing protein n=2 Tax=Afipia carboxydohydrogena TaxID=290 RepID=A0ABY8BPQ0_AFICR|nr:DUF411 domain-containing protein [[Pseudomonas] carboxydohydrogena]
MASRKEMIEDEGNELKGRIKMNTGDVSRRSALGLVAAALIAPTVSVAAQTTVIRVHKDPNCGCCSGWVRHLEAAGFGVAVVEDTDLRVIRKRLGVPTDLSACHTAEAGGYVIEGHVPAAAIQRMLKERPVATGVAVPGMPVGSPGMEGGKPERYVVVLFGPDGRRAYMEFEGLRPVG